MRNRKGVATALVSLITGIFILSGSIFSGLMTEKEIKETVNYSTGHVNRLMEAQTKKNIYKTNIKNELKFVHNNVAYSKNETVWEDEVPEEEEIISNFKDSLMAGEYNLPDQNRVFRCIAPSIQKEDLEVIRNNELELNITGKDVTCHGGDSTAFVPINEAIVMENTDNNYLNLLKHGRTLALEADSRVESIEKEEIDVQTGCIEGGNKEEKGEKKAISEARSEILKDREDLAETIYGETGDSRESFISLENSKTSINGSKSVNLDPTSCNNNGKKYSGTVDFTPETLTTKYKLEDSQNEVVTYKGRKSIGVEIEYKKNLE